MNVPFNEYWSFLDHYCNLKTHEGLEKLEIYLKQKKLINNLETQIKSAQTIKNDRLNNKNGSSIENAEVIQKLNDFITLCHDLCDKKLFLSDHQLSHRYEHFLKFGQNLPKTNFDPLKLVEDEPIKTEDLEALGLNHADLEIYDSLARYMACIIDLSKLDKSSKCYFSLYKSAKQILGLLNTEKPFDHFYLSPVFKKLSSKKVFKSTAFDSSLFKKKAK